MKEALDEMEKKKLEKFGEDIYKYQKFNTKTILKKIDTDYAEETARYYINSGISYIKTGTVIRAFQRQYGKLLIKQKQIVSNRLDLLLGKNVWKGIGFTKRKMQNCLL